MFCFGVSNNSPEKSLAFLTRSQTIHSASEVSIVPVGKKLSSEAQPKRKVVFVVSIADFFRNLAVLNSDAYATTQVFVFASPLRINELTGCTPLDMEHDVANRGIGFRLAHSLNITKYRRALKVGCLPVKRDNARYLTSLTDNVKHGSLLTPLMTFIYTLPRATHQTPVKEAIARFFLGTSSLATLESALSSLLSEKNALKLRTLVSSEVANSYRAAFKDVRAQAASGEKQNLKPICKAHNVNDYEVKYLLSVVEGMKTRKHLRGRSMKDIQAKGLRPVTTRSKKIAAEAPILITKPTAKKAPSATRRAPK